ncbi:MAG: hypothetical protein HYY57_05235 [Candidatus Omnitrophica bacterium]|nr:hypothetical protein [Candidatus Omnitrophota bacterium]
MQLLIRGILVLLALIPSGCAALWAGAGATGVAAAYEARNKRELDELEKAYKKGELNQEEYLRQKDEDHSVVY